MASGFGPDGKYHIEITGRRDPIGPGGTGGSGGSGGGNSSKPSQQLVMHNGQLGYWTEGISGGKNDHPVRHFTPVGPSEAQKAATAAKALQEKQQAEATAKAAAAKAAQDAAKAAEKARQDAIKTGAAAGALMTVANAQKALDAATAESGRLSKLSAAAANTAIQKRQAAGKANAEAIAAEKALSDLLAKAASGGMAIHKGNYGRWVTRTTGGKNDHTTTTFIKSGITVAQVTTAQTKATSLRNSASQRTNEANTADKATANARTLAHNAETKRLAAVAALNSAKEATRIAENKRKADEAAKAAEVARMAAEKEKARQTRQAAADRLRSSNIQSVRGISYSATSSSLPLSWSVASAGGIALDSELAAGIWARIGFVLAELRGAMTASVAGPIFATIAGLLYSKEAGLGSDIVPGRDISAIMPGDMFPLPDLAALSRAAESGTGVSMPIRGRLVMREDGTLETQFVRTQVTGNVPVVRAVFDKESGYWGYSLSAIAGVPSQTILVSPANAPGTNGPIGLTGPVPLPERIVDTGSLDSIPQGISVIVSPVADELDLNDLILIFPPEAALKPLYIMVRSPRNIPGKAGGKGQQIGENWLGASGTGAGAPVPSQIADKLRGREFGNFDAFRRSFWREVASDPELSEQFSSDDITLMKLGRAPTVRFRDSVGKRIKVELHHQVEISKGGEVYNVDNLTALTPKRHIEIHKGK